MVEQYDVTNCTFTVLDPKADFSVNGAQGYGRFRANGNRITCVGSFFLSPASVQLNTAALPGAVDTATDVITITGFSADATSGDLGRYAYDPVKVFASGITPTLPSPLVPNRTYYLTRLTADTLKLSTTQLNAIAGVYIDLTTAGTGTFNIFMDYGLDIEWRGTSIEGIDRHLDFVPADVDTTNDTITIPGHGMKVAENIAVMALPGGGVPAGLTSGATVYSIVVDDDTIALAANTTDANNGTKIDLTTTGTVGGYIAFGASFDFIDITGYTPVRLIDTDITLPASWHNGTSEHRLFTLTHLQQVRNLTLDVSLGLPGGDFELLRTGGSYVADVNDASNGLWTVTVL